MIIKTLFQNEGGFAVGEVEIKLLPGIPNLHIVGQPDGHIRECGIKLKSALRSCQLAWPQGHQIVVNLRPSHFRKSSAGLDLAVALGFLALTKQLPAELCVRLQEMVVYGELALDGRVFAPHDLEAALRASPAPVLSGELMGSLREGSWWQLNTLAQAEPTYSTREFDWSGFWRRPEFPDWEFESSAAEALILAAHMRLNILLAGPQGSGKSTWAKALLSLTDTPDCEQARTRRDLFGEQALESRWRPFEKPHHTITPHAMIGGGLPLFPGVISRAHGGVLVMDEFLEFDRYVLEALREPIENGYIDQARRGERTRFPADFQLIATTNLCPCGRLNPRPDVPMSCSRSLTRCRSICERLSGPLMDRFDLVVMSHLWLRRGERRRFSWIEEQVKAAREFAQSRGNETQPIPDWVAQLELSHRRRDALLRVARGLADREQKIRVQDEHYSQAFAFVEKPMADIRQLFA